MAEKKSKIPYIFVAFFAVIFAVDFFYIYLAQTTWRGVSTQDSYHKGLNYNQSISAVEDQKNLGWKIDIKYRNDGNKTGVLTVDLADKNSAIIRDAKIKVNFKRPIQEGFDFSKDLEFVKNKYKAEITFPLKGQWEFELVISRDGEVFQEVKRYVVQ
jgi:nitrogen fixation protein FixH